jgi:hypothetical protein
MNSGKEPFDGDDLVTETYRELGVENAPEHLNQSVLRMASGGSPARNILFGAWMKPVAWAATIGLSLAIVLELSEVPTAPVQSDPVRSDSMPTAESMREEALEEAPVLNAAGSEKVENRARPESAPNRQLVSEDELGRSTAAFDDVEVFSREPKGKLDAVAAPAAPSQPPLAAMTEIPAAKELASVLPEAKKRAADLPADSQPIASFANDLCNAAARLSEESWLACIENLRRAGSEEAADREYEAFILKYPLESSDLEGNK